MKKKKLFAAAITFVCICLLLSGAYIKAMADTNTDTICKGIFINSINLEGMTEAEATKAVNEYTDSLKNKKLDIRVNDQTISTTLGEVGYECVENDYVSQALNLGKTGNLIKRYKEIEDLEHNQLVYTLQFTIDDDKLRDVVEQCSEFNVLPENATIKRENGQFIVSEDKNGWEVDLNETMQKVKTAILEDWDYQDAVVDAVIVEALPEFGTETMKECKDLLGTFSTTYASSSSSRANNLANAARLMNGIVVYPGEVFSAAKAMQPITEENGYSIAGAYQNGQVVDSVGGGVCQVATTLYNAILHAELEVVERSNHSMIVGYVKPAMDAAIAGDYKDLKFKNNTDIPVYIEVYTVGRKITFSLYGKETRDIENRKIEFISQVTQTIPPGKEKITKDPTKPISYREVTQQAHVGYKAILWKVVTVNGVEISREQVNYSSYAAEPAYVIIGTKPEEEETEEANAPVASPKPTPAPKPTQKPTPKPTKEPVQTDDTDNDDTNPDDDYDLNE